MSLISVILATLSFTAIAIYLGGNYTRLHMTGETWLIITVITSVIFIIKYIADMFKKEED